jgi:hypothetical protein
MMNRIAPQNHHAKTHPEAVRWLTDFMIDLKKTVLLKQPYQPFTLDRLDEWNTHHADISECLDFEAPLSKWTGEPPLEHQQALTYFYELVADLKVIVGGHTSLLDNITEERIKEADNHYSEIARCRKRRTIYY